MYIGKKLKQLRKDRQMTLNALSQKSGVAVATLSRMEHDIMTGTLESHVKICQALGVSLGDFYKEVELDTKSVSVVKQKEKHDSYVHPKNSTIELLTTKIMSKKMMPMLLRISKSGQTHKEENKPGSEKFIYVLEGTLTAKVGKEEHHLVKGDSLYFDASLPHTFINSGKSDITAICILTPPEF